MENEKLKALLAIGKKMDLSDIFGEEENGEDDGGEEVTIIKKRSGKVIDDPAIEAAEERTGLDIDKDEGNGETSGEKPYSQQTASERLISDAERAKLGEGAEEMSTGAEDLMKKLRLRIKK